MASDRTGLSYEANFMTTPRNNNYERFRTTPDVFWQDGGMIVDQHVLHLVYDGVFPVVQHLRQV